MINLKSKSLMQIWVQQLKFFWPCESFYEKWVTCLTKEHTTLYKKNYLINPEKNNHKKKTIMITPFIYIYIFPCLENYSHLKNRKIISYDQNVFVEETQGHSKPTGLSQVVLGGLLGQSLIQPNNVESTHETYLKIKTIPTTNYNRIFDRIQGSDLIDSPTTNRLNSSKISR